MKKFKKSIEISTENISDVLQVPIVTNIYKSKNFKNPCIDICDTWYVFSKAGWEKHKNDEIKDKEE